MKLPKLDTRIHLIYYVLTTTVCLQVCASLNLVCDTPDCKKLADYYKKNMNEQAKPCTDFYDYACHGWGAQNPRPKDKFMWNTEQLLKALTNHRLRGIFENQRMNTDQVFQNSKALYKACMDLPHMKISDASTVKAVMAEVGNWPMFSTKTLKESANVPWWQIESQYINKAGESSIMECHLITNFKKSHEIIPFLFQQYSPFGMLKLVNPFHPELRKHYKAFLTDIINNVASFSINAKGFTNIIEKDLDDVIKFREQMAAISKTFMPNGTAIMGISEFQKRYDGYDHGQETAKINWLEMVRSFYKNSKDQFGMVVQPTSKIFVDINYMSKVAKELGRTPKRVLENHVHLYFAERHLKLDKQMEANLEKSVISGYRPTGYIRYEPERWELCIQNHNMAITASQMYVLTYFSKDIKQEIEKLVDEERQIFKTLISQSSWMDSNTKAKSLNKLDKLITQIGYPEWYMNSTISPDLTMDVDPTAPDAFYTGVLNRIAMSASYLQWPIFIPNMPYSAKFGSIGTALAHEMHHGFDNIGLQYDAYGNHTLWWPQNMLDKFQNQSKCIEYQYHEYKRAELKKRHITKIPEVSTLNEDIADIMGIKIAYIRYKNELQKNNGSCPVLPGFEKLGCDKLFFIAFANLHCGDSSPSSQEASLLSDPHSSLRTRVNGAVSNMKEFHQIFGCKPNDPIVPAKMCDIWK